MMETIRPILVLVGLIPPIVSVVLTLTKVVPNCSESHRVGLHPAASRHADFGTRREGSPQNRLGGLKLAIVGMDESWNLVSQHVFDTVGTS